MDEVAAGSVRAEAGAVEGPAQFGFVLGVAGHAPQLLHAVRELALVTVLADAVLLEGPAQFGLVAAGVAAGLGLSPSSPVAAAVDGRRLAGRPLQLPRGLLVVAVVVGRLAEWRAARVVPAMVVGVLLVEVAYGLFPALQEVSLVRWRLQEKKSFVESMEPSNNTLKK